MLIVLIELKVLVELAAFDVLAMLVVLAGFAVLLVCSGTVSELSSSGSKLGILS